MRRLVKLTVLGLVTASFTTTSAAAQRRQWEQPNCELRTSHFLVNSAVLYLSAAASSSFEDQQDRELRNAARVLRDALNRGQEENPAVWYLWGRYYEMKSDLAGMDSSYTRAQEMEPACADDIAARRHRLWVPLLNAGISAYQEGDSEAAIRSFSEANFVKPGDPHTYYYMGDIQGRALNAPDSAIAYFEMALDRLDESNAEHAEMIQNSTYMVGRFFQIVGNLDSAATWYETYLDIDPADGEVIGSLARVYTQLGRTDDALAVYDNILANADAMDPLDLFDAGVSLFVNELYEKAAMAFELGLERNPNYRDGIYNLANTYIAQSQGLADSLEGEELAAAKKSYGEKLDPYTATLLEVDPGNQQAHMLRAQSFQLLGEPDSTLAYLEKAQDLAFDITVDMFQFMGGDTFTAHGLITNLGDGEATSMPLTFEFVDQDGAVVVSEVVGGQTLGGGELGEFELNIVGPGIVAWRYSVGSSE